MATKKQEQNRAVLEAKAESARRLLSAASAARAAGQVKVIQLNSGRPIVQQLRVKSA